MIVERITKWTVEEFKSEKQYDGKLFTVENVAEIGNN